MLLKSFLRRFLSRVGEFFSGFLFGPVLRSIVAMGSDIFQDTFNIQHVFYENIHKHQQHKVVDCRVGLLSGCLIKLLVGSARRSDRGHRSCCTYVLLDCRRL